MLRSFLIALQFLTRVPVPGLKTREAEIGPASAFFPLVGALIGVSAALIFRGASRILPHSTSIILILIFMSVITNAFHEDGLADALDGFGGGWSREAVLAIMKDSRLGTFGALGLIFLILAKYNLLSLIDPSHLWRWLVFAPTAGRWSALPLCLGLDYAREEGQAKLVARRIPRLAFVFGTLTLLVSSLVLGFGAAALALSVAVAVVLLTGWYYRHRLGGVTGDCLGATNQLVEVAVYLVAVALMTKNGG
jgi:adenosylcobinamide-GDP ribazoletransferase